MRTSRLKLRPFTPDDVTAIHRAFGDPEVMRYVGDGLPRSFEGSEAMVLEYIRAQKERGYSFWAIVEVESGELIGDAGLTTRDGEIELGYTLARRWWGRGYATEAAEAWVSFAADTLEVGEVTALVDPENPASAKVLGKLGFERDGQKTVHGRPHDRYRRVIA